MNVDYVNHFIQGTKQVLKNVCGVDVKMGKVAIISKPFEDKINISIGIIGDAQGIVNYAISNEAALFLASKMMLTEIKQLDEISKSAICELSNMISGNVATLFSAAGSVIDIKPPKFKEDYSEFEVEKLVCIPLELEAGKIFEVNVHIE